MILTGDQIVEEVRNGRILVDPFVESHVGPNSLDVRLHPELKRIVSPVLSVAQPYMTEDVVLHEAGTLLRPGELYLGVTVEHVYTPFHVPLYEGRSTMARYFIESHFCAGLGDCGFRGAFTLEIRVARPTVVFPMMRIGQLVFHTVQGTTGRQYKGAYAGSRMPISAKPNNF